MQQLISKVTSEFISYRNSRVRKFNANGRDIVTRLFHGDCEYAEYIYTHTACTGHVASDKPQYDTEHPQLGRCEWKCITNTSATMKEWCLKQDFDTFVFWKFVNKPNEVLQEGDMVTVEIVSIMSKDEALKKAKTSRYNNNDKFIFVSDMI